jgi:uncharacterized lipoprotein YajG
MTRSRSPSVMEDPSLRRRSMTKALVLAVVAVVTVVAACSGDDDDATPSTLSNVTTVVSSATTSPGTTSPATTDPPATDPPTTSPPTEPAPPTTTEDDLKAVIAADVEAALQANYAALVDPSLEALPSQLPAIAVPGSPIEASFTAYISQLVGLGDGIIPGDPDILILTAESVELVGNAPYEMALVTICEVDNRPQATLSKNTSDGRIIYVDGTGDLQALRSVQDVRLTPVGWRLYDSLAEGTFRYLGESACPPE